MSYECEYCGKIFDKPRSLSAHYGTCVKYTEFRAQNNIITKTCPVCNKKFTVDYAHRNQQTCSKSCSVYVGREFKKVLTKTCPICKTDFQTTSEQKICCSSNCANKHTPLRKKYPTADIASASYDKHICAECGGEYYLWSFEEDNGFCSLKCKHTNERKIAKEKNKIVKQCVICGKEFITDVRHNKSYCGAECGRKLSIINCKQTLKKQGRSVGFGDELINKKISDTVQRRYNVPYYCMTKHCRTANSQIISKTNKNVYNKILEKYPNCDIELEFRIGNFSYDIRVNNYLIEIDPSYTHSCTTSSHFSPPKDLDYHRNKTDLAKSSGYKCIHIFDWDDLDKVLEIINPNKTKIYARKCSLQKLDKKVCDDFLIKYHLQNTCKNQVVRLGLFYNNELVQIMTFGKPRFNTNYDYELLRLCTKSGYVVIGGAQKLLKNFLNGHSGKIISYCDLSKFSGNIYSDLGFHLIRINRPTIIWFNFQTKRVISETSLLKQGADRLLGTSFGKYTSNSEILKNNGYVGVANCGQAVYELL